MWPGAWPWPWHWPKVDETALEHWLYAPGIYIVVLSIFAFATVSRLKPAWDAGDKLPQLKRVYGHAVDGGKLYDYGLIPILKMTLECYLFSFGYGTCAVLMCNVLVVDVVPDDIGWLIVLIVQFLSCTFACTFSGNSIHLATSTQIHFFYYGAGFLPIMLYHRLPPWWLALGCILFTLLVYVLARVAIYPNYPAYWSTHPLYSRDFWTGEPKLVAMPRLGGDAFFKSAWTNGVFTTCARTYLVFPVFEILHLQIVVGLAIGFITGILVVYTPVHKVATLLWASATDSDGLIISTFFFSNLIWLWRITVGLGPLGAGDVYRTLARFHQRFLDFVTINLGALAMLHGDNLQELSVHNLLVQALILIAVHGNHFIGLLIFVQSLAGAMGHEDWGLQKLVNDDLRYVQVDDIVIDCTPYKYNLHKSRKYDWDVKLTQRMYVYNLLQFIASDWKSFPKPAKPSRIRIT